MITPTLETKYIFTITAKIGDVITVGELANRMATRGVEEN